MKAPQSVADLAKATGSCGQNFGAKGIMQTQCRVAQNREGPVPHMIALPLTQRLLIKAGVQRIHRGPIQRSEPILHRFLGTRADRHIKQRRVLCGDVAWDNRAAARLEIWRAP